MKQNPISRTMSFLGFGLGGAAMMKYGDTLVSFSGPTLLGAILIIAITVIIILFRLTDRVDLVELVKAWRSHDSAPQQTIPTKKLPEEDKDKVLPSTPIHPEESDLFAQRNPRHRSPARKERVKKY